MSLLLGWGVVARARKSEKKKQIRVCRQPRFLSLSTGQVKQFYFFTLTEIEKKFSNLFLFRKTSL